MLEAKNTVKFMNIRGYRRRLSCDIQKMKFFGIEFHVIYSIIVNDDQQDATI